jgi:electron transfer flavoprotein alpha subunit
VILVIGESGSEAGIRSTRETIAIAQPLGAPISVVVPGHTTDATTTAAELSTADVGEIVRLEHELLGDYTSDAYVVALAAYVRASRPALVLLSHSYRTRDFAPRLAARLERHLVSDCVAIRGTAAAFVFTRPIFQGKLLADVVLEEPGPHFATVQAGAVRADAIRLGTSPAPTRRINAEIAAAGIRTRQSPPFRQTRDAIDLTKAERIVSAGRGFKEESQIALARELASALGAELAASRPVCDAGWLPMERQVGSSGQTVAPRLYVALGISGAIQHIVGMKGSKTIVAVNKDPDAPIFEIAHYGIVGDLFEVVPALIEALGGQPGARA